jgi:hypothetical protein
VIDSIEVRGGETEIDGRELVVRRLQLDDRRFGFGRRSLRTCATLA